ncbi:MAG: DUF1501 domain-containing protein [Flavobacteriales bacterium]|nr:DUF1501 domain-containing protein [Flavobacteriales bacterium]
MSRKHISRRKFIGQASCAALGTTTALNSILHLDMMGKLTAPTLRPMRRQDGTYKAMVCILLAGGNDSYNMLIPTSTDQYNTYSTSRSNLALPSGDLLALNYTDGNGVNYGLHPSMPEVQQLFNDGKLAFVSNVGTLIEPTTKTQVLNQTVPLPVGLLSHSDQARHWMSSVPQSRQANGWGGRIADIVSSLNSNQNVSMGISLSGTNLWQLGADHSEYAIQNYGSGSVGIQVLESGQLFEQIIGGGVESMLNQTYQDIFKQTYRDKILSSQSQHEEFSAAIDGVEPFATMFSDNPLSQDLHMIAKAIAANGTLDVQRQTFFVNFGGWDHHDEVLDNQAAMLAIVSQALSEFYSALEEVNLADCVTTFTASDFARTLSSNGNGTDHAWGGNAIVMGGSVQGGQIYGEYPDLAIASDIEVGGGGVLIPQISTDEYFAELAMWFGVQDSDFEYLLPNLGNFFEVGSGQPLGFMNL